MGRPREGREHGHVPGLRWSMAELVVSPDSRLPVGRQVEVQLARAVLEGRIPRGTRLPSTRRLAARLPVHRNTVAASYRRLARRGLVSLRRGAPARVAGGREPRVRTGEVGAASAAAGNGVAVVMRDPGSRQLAVHELRTVLGGTSVTGCETPRALAGTGGGRERLAVVEAGQLGEARRILASSTATPPGPRRSADPRPSPASPPYSPPPATRLLPLLHARLTGFRELVTSAGLMDVVLVLSAAPELRRALRETAAALRGDEVAVLAPDPGDRGAVERGLGCATVTCADALAGAALADALAGAALATREAGGSSGGRPGPVRPLRLVSHRTVRELRAMV